MITRFAKLLALLGILFLHLADARAAVLDVTYGSATDVPVTQSGNYDAVGTVNFTLSFAPPVGTNLTVVRLTGLGTINGTFANLAQNQSVTLSYAGQGYAFVANYNAGPASNDLVLQWAGTRAMTWGNNGNGQAGNGVPDSINTLPVAVTSSGVLAGKTVIAMAAGRNHTLALCSDGTLAGWGLNTSGQIGSDGGSQSNVPVLISTLGALSTKRVIAIAAGETHSLALCADGTVAAWGTNSNGQLGNGGGGTTATPTLVYTGGVLSGKRVVAIAAGQYHSMALLSTGAVVTWGYNFYGQLGNKSTTTSPVPVSVSTGTALAGKTVTAIAAGQAHCIALCSDGALATWGANVDGQLGNNDSAPSNEPVAVTTTGTVLAAKTVTAIAAGGFHCLALCADGIVAAWGQNTNGQLGITAGSHSLPQPVYTGSALLNKTVVSIAAGSQHSLALCSDGTLAAWGLNGTGQLGTGNQSTSGVPVNVSTSTLTGGAKFQVTACGPNAQHSLAITAVPYNGLLLTAGTLISNGSFETGLTNWTVSDISNPSVPLAVRTNGFPPGNGLFSTVATDGIRSLSSGFNGLGPSVIRVSHDLAVTAVEPYVRFDWRAGWDMLSSSSSTLPRTFSVAIEPVGGGPVLQSTVMLTAAPHTKNLDTGSQDGAVDLSAFVGTTVRVCFDLTVPEVNTGPAFFQLDNVRTAALQPASVNPITRAATAVTLKDATLNGTVNAGGLSTTVQFEYGTTANYGSTVAASPSPVGGNTDTAVTAVLSSLNGNTLYHCRVKTTNSSGTKYGADATFTTLPHAPGVSGLSSNNGPSGAFLSATVEPDSSATVVTFEYGLTTGYGSSTPAWEGPFSAPRIVNGQVSGLTGDVTYHYRVKAQNAGGITYSEDSIFTPFPTPPGSPTLATLPPIMVSRNGATFKGTANANGSTSTVDFDFGTTTNYSTHISAFPGSVNGSADTAIAGSLGGLSAGTTYHYRTRAFHDGVVSYGPDVTFTTPPIGFPAASTDTVTNITPSTVILRGFATANNGPVTTVSFEYGTDTNYGSVATVPGLNFGQSFVSVSAQIPFSGSAVTYHYRVKATNHIGTTYGQDMTFTTPDVHEARLYGLALGSGTLSPAFDRNVTSYTLSLPFEAASLWLAPTASTAIGSVLVNGSTVASGGSSGPIALNIGSNLITITVTSLDGQVPQNYTITVTRAAPVAGNLDLSFNSTGTVSTDLGGYNFIYGMTIQPDGKIVAVGAATNGNDDDFAVVRYNPDGTPDTTFGGGTGKVTTGFQNSGDTAGAVAVQGNGRIVVAGSAGNGINSDFGAARYNADGTPDLSFNGTGKVITAFPHPPFLPGGANATCLALQSDGKILVAGSAQNGTDNDFAIVRYHGDLSTGTPGTLDTTFGTGGVVTTHMGGDDLIFCMTLQPDGKILVAGETFTGGTTVDSALARYDADGTLDTTFNGTGKVVASLSTDIDGIYGLAVQPDGKIVAAGLASNGTNYDFLLARFHGDVATGATGTLDTAFGSAGKVITAVGTGDDYATGVVLQPDGKIVVGGAAHNGANRTFAILRHNADGTLDTTFHGTGIATPDFGSADEGATCIALQGDGKIVVGGSMIGIFNDFAVARLLGDGPGINVQTPPGTNVFDGISTVPFPGALPGASTSVTFTIQNTGTANLTGLGLSVDGTDSTAFTVTASPAAPVPASGSTTFTVRFLPASLGNKTAALHLASNVTGSTQSLDIGLTGQGLTVLENWRQVHFDLASHPGEAADDADPNGNGICNLVEYALKGDPTGHTTGTDILPHASTDDLAGNRLNFTFTRHVDRPGVTLIVQGADLPAGPWSDLATNVNAGGWTGLAPGALVRETPLASGDPSAIVVTVIDPYQTTDPAHPSRFMRLKVTIP